MQNKLLNLLKYLLGWPFSVIALFFIVKLIAPQIPSFITNVGNLNSTFFISGIICFLLFYLIRSYIWYELTKLYSDKISYRKSAYFWSISELKRYIPGNIWSFLGRALLFEETGIKKKETGKLLIAEAFIFVLGASAISLVALPFVATHFFRALNMHFQVLISYFMFLVLLLYIFRERLSYKIFKILPQSDATTNLFMIFLSATACLSFGLGNYFVIGSIISLPINLVFQLSGFFVLSLLLGYLSVLTPAGFGVREAIVIAGLSKITSVANGALAALFSRIILIISELIFVILTYALYKIRNKKIQYVENWISKHKHEVVLIFLFLLYVLYFSITSFLRFNNFYAGRFDLGNMAQTVWNTTRGRIFVFTNPNGTDMVSRLAFHADFLLVLLAPLYAILPDPKTLLFIQSLVVGAGSFFVYLIARDKLKNKNIALAFAFSYLINPSVERATLYDFHSVALATAFLLAAYYFFDKRRYVYFVIFAILAGISKEQIWLIIALFGFLISFKNGSKAKIIGVTTFFACIGIFYYLIAVAIPHTSGASHFALTYYSDFGDGPLTIIKTIILSPTKIVKIISSKERLNYLVQLFGPVGFLSILSPFYLIFALPDLTINLLSNNSQLHQIYYHYTAAITPFIFMSAISGVGIILRTFKKLPLVILTIYIMAASLLTAYLFGPLPGSKDPNVDMFIKQDYNASFIDSYLTRIPRRLSVASSNNIGSHLSQRRRIYTLPLGIDKADVIVFLLNASEPAQSLKLERTELQKLRNDKNYRITIEKDEFIVFAKKNLKQI